tara:strand:+ start:162 stop:407 length:246 start_codon:yes stop_codon:yes gene_type:complete
MTDETICKVFDFTAIKKAIEDKHKVYIEVSPEEWEDCVFTLFCFMTEQGYDPHEQSEIIDFVKDYFPDLSSNDNDKGTDDD